MKIELVKETDAYGNVRYSTEIDGKFQTGSLSADENEARGKFDFILTGKNTAKEVLITVEV